MDPLVSAALVNAGAGAANSILGYFGQSQSNAMSLDQMKYQNEWNLQMWNKQNEYNNPKNTMQRLTDAGINPRAYQQIGQFANAVQPQAAEKATLKSPISSLQLYTDVINDYMDYRIKDQQLQNLKEQNNLMSSQASYYMNNADLVNRKSTNEELNFALNLLGRGIVDPNSGKPFEQAYGYALPKRLKDYLINRELGVSDDAFYRAMLERVKYNIAKEDYELGISDSGIQGLAKGLLRWPVRFGKWTFDLYNKK